MRLEHHAGPIRHARVACLLPIIVVAGCANPLRVSPLDFAATPDARIHTIRQLDLSEYAEADRQPDSPSVERPESPLLAEAAVPLTLETVRASAIENNLTIRATLYNPEIAQQGVDEEEARFDSVFRIDANYSETDTPTASTLNSAEANSQFVQPTLTKPLLTGGSVDLSFPVSRVSTDNTFTTLNPSYEADFVVRLTQPLLRNAGRRAATAPLRLAGINRSVAQVRARAEVASTLTAIDRSYWQLWAARRELELRIEEFEVAREVLQQAKRLVNAGSAAEIEVIRAESGVSDRISTILRLEQLVLRTQRELKRGMNDAGLAVTDGSVIETATDPSPVPLQLDTRALLDTAASARAELLEFELELLADATRVDLARNEALPQLDLTATYRRNGLGGDLDPAAEQSFSGDFEDYSFGLTASMPIGNEAAEARIRRAALQRLARIASKEARSQTIEQEVLDASDRIRTDWQRIVASRQSVALNARTLQAEQRQFDAGRSTSIDVLEAAGRLAAARAEEIRAIADYELAQIALAEATGTILGMTRVALRDAPDAQVGGSATR